VFSPTNSPVRGELGLLEKQRRLIDVDGAVNFDDGRRAAGPGVQVKSD